MPPLPEEYVHQQEREGTLYVRFWDMAEFLHYVTWMKSSGAPGQNVVWLKNAYPRAAFQLGYI